MSLFFLPHSVEIGEIYSLNQSQTHHLKQVLRKKLHDFIEICSAQETRYQAQIVTSDDLLKIKILHLISPISTSKSQAIWLCQSILKNPRMDWLIEKAVELQTDQITPIASQRCIPQFKNQLEKTKRIDRWKKLAHAASQQSQRSKLPQIHPIESFKNLIQYCQSLKASKLLFHPQPEKISLSASDFIRWKSEETIILLMGPEGGFTAEEVSHAQQAGFETVCLGHHILRGETASLAAIAIIQFLTQS